MSCRWRILPSLVLTRCLGRDRISFFKFFVSLIPFELTLSDFVSIFVWSLGGQSASRDLNGSVCLTRCAWRGADFDRWRCADQKWWWNVASVKLTLYRCPFNGCLTVSVCFNRRCCPEWLYNLIYLTHFTLATTVGASRVSVVFFLEHNVFFVFRAFSAVGLIVSIRVSRCWMKLCWPFSAVPNATIVSESARPIWLRGNVNEWVWSQKVLINWSLSAMLVVEHDMFRTN